jgi:membrane protein DedA with SNARE-associated domain
VPAHLDHVTQLVLASPWLLALLMVVAVIDAVLPVVPSEALIITAGVAAASGLQDLPVVIAAAAVGAFLGETTGYLIGRTLGPAVRGRWARRGTRALVYDRITQVLATRGGLILLTARFVPGGRTFSSLTAGASRYPTHRFFGFISLGTPLSATWSAMLGFLGGAMFADKPLLGLVFGIAIGSTVALSFEAVRRWRGRVAARRVAASPA